MARKTPAPHTHLWGAARHRARLLRAVALVVAIGSATFGASALAAEFNNIKSVSFSKPTSDRCDSEPCARMTVTVKARVDGKTKSQKRQVRVNATLMSQLRSMLGKADNRYLDSLSRSLLSGLSSSSNAVREGTGEALIAVAERRGWSCTSIQRGVRVPKAKRRELQRIGCSFRVAAGQPITVTSGTRSVKEQASALDKKIRAGDKRLSVYKNRTAANQLVDAWRAASKTSKGSSATRKALERAIGKQVKSGVYLSKHLRAGAVDVRSVGMSRKRKRAFRNAVRSVPGARVIEERRPPHFHVELP